MSLKLLLCRSIRKIPTIANRSYTINTALFNSQRLINRKVSKIEAGQPLHETRPHLIKPTELTPGITAIEYHERRARFMKQLPEKSVVIINSNNVQYASGAVFYPFQQDNDFFYLTGWNEPGSVMILEKFDDTVDGWKFYLFVPPKDSFIEKWEGFRTGQQGACDIFNADESFNINDLSEELPKLINRNRNIWIDKHNSINDLNNRRIINNIIDQNVKGVHLVNNYKNKVAQLRKFKSDAELKIMRTAGKISGRSYNQAFAKRFRNERTLASFLEHKFISGGCDKNAYVPVVASGANSLCIHYTRNDDLMFEDEMVLVDASGSVGGYCSDISRTWPNNGKFSDVQRDIYQAVLNVQKQCIKLCKESNQYSLNDIHEKSLDFMQQEVKNLGFANVNRHVVERLYPHYIGHNLGLDVHDIPECSRYEPLKKGQVITIEPGLYIPDDPQYPSHFRNIGVRIEDDIAVGNDTYTNLTVEAVKEIVDLEQIMKNGETLFKFQEDVVEPLTDS